MTEQLSIFISYSRKDSAFVDRLVVAQFHKQIYYKIRTHFYLFFYFP